MKGYLKNPEANADVFVDRKWLRSGDLVKINEDGTIVVVDRLKELIKVFTKIVLVETIELLINCT